MFIRDEDRDLFREICYKVMVLPFPLVIHPHIILYLHRMNERQCKIKPVDGEIVDGHNK